MNEKNYYTNKRYQILSFFLSWCWNSKYSFFLMIKLKFFFRILSRFHLLSFRNFLLSTFRRKENASQKCEVKERDNCPKEKFQQQQVFRFSAKKNQIIIFNEPRIFILMNKVFLRSFLLSVSLFRQNFYNWKNFPEELIWLKTFLLIRN